MHRWRNLCAIRGACRPLATCLQLESLQALPLAALVDCLKRFWTYGLAAAPPFPAAQPLREKNSLSTTPSITPMCV